MPSATEPHRNQAGIPPTEVAPVEIPFGASRLVGPPAELRFPPADIALAASGGTGRQVLRFSQFGDYSVHDLARRN